MYRSNLLAIVVAIWATAAWGAEPPADLAAKVQSVFAKHCYKCHGPSSKEGGLRLSSRDGALAELDSGDRAIVPKDPKHSVILTRLRAEDESERMPPEGKPLSKEDIALVELWINHGAPWSEHWSYRAAARPAVPKVEREEWVRNPIDAFILRRLEAAGLPPAPPAEKIALLRRATYDLTGLPPTLAEIDAFLKDDSPDAFAKVVDRLLDSPQYGEKWARHWLDLVRYAETNGYERDDRKDLIWKYRDYVIRAFNQDKPFDRFIMEQLAGDELADSDADSITATGFYRLGIWDDEPVDRELARYDYLDDIQRTTGEVFLGMTIGCARCHDHKIDPVTQKDYYSFLAFFADISPHGKDKANLVALPNTESDTQFKQKLAAKRKREADLEANLADIEQMFVSAMAQRHPEIKLEQPEQAEAVFVATSQAQGQQWEYTFTKPAENWFEIAFDDSGWKKGPGGFGRAGTPGSHVRTAWHTADIWMRKDFRLSAIPSSLALEIHHDEDVSVYLNGKLIATLTGYTTEYQRIDVTAKAAEVLQTGRNTLAVHCHQTGGGQYVDVGLVRGDPKQTLAQLFKKYGDEILGSAKIKQWTRQRAELDKSLASDLQPVSELAMAVAEQGRHQTWILGRGSPQAKGEEVQPAFPQIVNPPAAVIPEAYNTSKSSGKRRVLAEWISSGSNPLTSRVIANRVWQYHFGRGIVRSASDFGMQGTPPTHPELLNWLAADLVDNGWRLKRMHKLIMTSNTYQMSSQANPKALAADPINDLFWRFDMRRLTAEEVRDSMLAVGGTLNLKMYGPSTFPPLPAEVLATASRPNAAWGQSPPEDASRRAIYIHVKRSLRPPMLANFDVPDTDTGCAVRVATTVPTQALGMLNSKFTNEQAAQFAARLERDCPNDTAAQVALAIRLTTARKAAQPEIDGDVQFIRDLVQQEKLSAHEALEKYCLLILNSNEFVYLD